MFINEYSSELSKIPEVVESTDLGPGDKKEIEQVKNLSDNRNFERFLKVNHDILKEKLKEESKEEILKSDFCHIIKNHAENKEVKRKRYGIYKKIFALFLKHKGRIRHSSNLFFEELSPKMFDLLLPIANFCKKEKMKVNFKELVVVLEKYFYV